ncbi:MAG: hypothetical protein AMXMBFR57_01680 [Acidimicrobiia bacterium]|jgi:capsular exopolysaccharide synthesis family protein
MFGDRKDTLIEPPAPAAPVAGLPGHHGGNEGEVHLLDRLSVLYRYRKVVLTVLVVVVLAGVVQTMTTTPEYDASAIVQVDEPQFLPGLQSSYDAMMADNDLELETQIQLLRSRDLAAELIGPLDLVNNPEFNGEGAAPTGFGGAVSSIGARIVKPIRGLFGGAEPTPEAIPSGANPAEIPTANAGRTMKDQLVDSFLERLDVGPQPGTRTLLIRFISRDPVVAANAANALAGLYVDTNLARVRGGLSERVESLTEEKKKVENGLREIELQMTEFRTTQNVQALADPAQLANSYFDAKSKLDEAAEAARIAREKYEAVARIPQNDPAIESNPEMFRSAEVQQWRRELANRQATFDRIRSQLGEQHDSYRAAQQDVANAQAELSRARTLVIERLKNEMDEAEATRSVRQRSLEAIEQVRTQVNSKGIDYKSLERMRDAQTELLQTLTTQVTEQGTQASAIRNNVWIVERAVPPAAPFKPDVSRNLLISLFLGFALAGALAFGLDYLDDTIKTPEDITRKLRVPFLGLVPSVRGDKQPVLSGPVPHDFGEAYRALRTSLVFTSGGESTRIITCTSAQPLEGKTTTACNLAMVLAFGGSRVLLIDADMRRPGVHKALKINNTVGLSHLLVGQARVREAIQRTSDPNFCVMTAGRTPPNPSELLSSERMKQLIANLKQGPFDWVVIDTPPVLAVTDAVILTPLVDGVTFVLGAEMTRRRLAERAVQMLMVSRPKVVGAVLNRVNFDRNKYYYSRYYGYQYKSYYGSGSTGSSVKA